MSSALRPPFGGKTSLPLRTSEAAINHELEVTFAPKGRVGTLPKFEERGPGLVAVVKVLSNALHEYPESVLLDRWRTVEYHYKSM